MPQCPRRTLLGGIGTTIAVAMAGNAATATENDAPTERGSETPSLEALLDALPASVATDSMAVTAIDFDRRRKANEPHNPRPTTGSFGIDPASVSKQVTVLNADDGYSRPVSVLAGDIQLAGDGERRETDDGFAYDRYEDDDLELVAGVTESLVVIAEDEGTIADSLAAKAGDGERLLEAEPVIEDALESHAAADSYIVQIGDGSGLSAADADVEYVVRAMTVRDPDTIEVTHEIAFEDAADVTDDLVERLTGDLAYMATKGEPTVETDGAVVTITAERDLAAERAVQNHESPGFLRPERDIDPDDDVLEIEIGRGDPTPVEDLTLEVGGEEYDREIWADGHGTLEKGDTIVIDVDDVEPNLSVTIRHDHEAGGSASSTTILDRFRFDFEYDADAETLTLEYADDFPLEGDSVSLAVYEDRPTYRPDGDGPEPRTTAQPWTGTLSAGDEATLENVTPGETVLVCWEGTSQQDSIAYHRVRPPGVVNFDYEYDSRTLSATLEFEDGDERPADAYELLLDDEPAATQWVDEHETVTSGATIDLEDVPAGTDVTVVWGDDDVRLGGTRTRPSIDLAFTDDETAVEHVGGDSLPASDLVAHVWTDDERIDIDLDEEIDGEFTEGDTFAVDADGIHHVTLVFDQEHHVGSVTSE